MEISKDTKVFISIAERPGNFGATVHNAGFQEIGFSGVYVPFRVSEGDLLGTISGIRSLGIKGCGVSMPHKTIVMDLLDNIDEKAKKIGAVNTIVNREGILTGYNTDCDGAMEAISEAYDISGKSVLLMGAGGVSRAIVIVLQESGAGPIFVTSRDSNKTASFAREFGVDSFPYESRNNIKADLFVNATPVGMLPKSEEMVIEAEAINNFQAIMDVVTNPADTLLLKEARKRDRIVIYGHRMSLFQAAAQFFLYTGQTAPIEVMSSALKGYLS